MMKITWKKNSLENKHFIEKKTQLMIQKLTLFGLVPIKTISIVWLKSSSISINKLLKLCSIFKIYIFFLFLIKRTRTTTQLVFSNQSAQINQRKVKRDQKKKITKNKCLTRRLFVCLFSRSFYHIILLLYIL